MPTDDPGLGERTTISESAEVCQLDTEPRELVRNGEEILLVWDLPWRDVYAKPVLPDSAPLAEYRRAFIEAGTDVRYPVSDPPDRSTPELEEIWRREFANQDLVYTEKAGTVRPINCLEALFFAYQTARYPQLSHPTEFIVAVVRRTDGDETRIRAYFGASDEEFPSHAVYPFGPAANDVEKGWTFWLALHNHTVQELDGKPALGVPVPSTNDVHLSRNLAREHGLQIVQVTNGFYTIDLLSTELADFQGPP